MAARNFLFLCMTCLMCVSCSSTSCCNWWGRNSDSSINLGRKPTPTQQGPIAGTYTHPGNTASPVSSTEYAKPPQQITTPPVGTTLPQDLNSPLMAPPTAPQNVTPSQYQSSGNTGTIPSKPLVPAGSLQLPDNSPSINQPAMPSIQGQVSMPQVQAPPLDLTMPSSASPVPLMLAPSNKEPALIGPATAPPAVEMPSIAPPNINMPLDFSPPKASMPGKSPSLNPGTTPPPLPANPTPPQFDKK